MKNVVSTCEDHSLYATNFRTPGDYAIHHPLAHVRYSYENARQQHTPLQSLFGRCNAVCLNFKCSNLPDPDPRHFKPLEMLSVHCLGAPIISWKSLRKTAHHWQFISAFLTRSGTDNANIERLKSCCAIEPVPRDMKTYSKFGRHDLKGSGIDKIDAPLRKAGHDINLRVKH